MSLATPNAERLSVVYMTSHHPFVSRFSSLGRPRTEKTANNIFFSIFRKYTQQPISYQALREQHIKMPSAPWKAPWKQNTRSRKDHRRTPHKPGWLSRWYRGFRRTKLQPEHHTGISSGRRTAHDHGYNRPDGDDDSFPGGQGKGRTSRPQ
jgi:hypothetical protein